MESPQTSPRPEVALLIETLVTDLPRGFECMVRVYQRRFYVLALRMLDSAPDAEEVTQDTFVRAYRALAGYPPERVRAIRLEPWLYRILLNLTRNRVRVRHQPAISLEAQEEEERPVILRADASAEPEVAFQASEDGGTLARAVAHLPFHMRAAVILRHVEGHTYREIAQLLDQPEGTVKAHVSRGTRLLRGMLVEEFSPVAGGGAR